MLVDPAPASGASVVAPGLLAPVTEAHFGEEDVLKLNLASAGMYPDFIAELEELTREACGYERYGTLVVARDEDDVAELNRLLAFQRELQLDVEFLDARAVRHLEPGLTSRLRGGLFARNDHRVDPGALTGALVIACERVGVKMVQEHVVRISAGDRFAVITETSTLDADTVVFAAGARGAAIELPPGVALPVRPVKGQVVALRADGEPPASANVRSLDVYVVARGDGRIALGATMEERGFDERVTAEAVRDLLNAAYEILPAIADAEFVGARVGFRPATPDNAPLIGRSAIDGLLIATGHFRNGIVQTPITGAAIAALASGEGAPEVDIVSPLRFGGAA